MVVVERQNCMEDVVVKVVMGSMAVEFVVVDTVDCEEVDRVVQLVALAIRHILAGLELVHTVELLVAVDTLGRLVQGTPPALVGCTPDSPDIEEVDTPLVLAVDMAEKVRLVNEGMRYGKNVVLVHLPHSHNSHTGWKLPSSRLETVMDLKVEWDQHTLALRSYPETGLCSAFTDQAVAYLIVRCPSCGMSVLLRVRLLRLRRREFKWKRRSRTRSIGHIRLCGETHSRRVNGSLIHP